MLLLYLSIWMQFYARVCVIYLCALQLVRFSLHSVHDCVQVYGSCTDFIDLCVFDEAYVQYVWEMNVCMNTFCLFLCVYLSL